MITYNKKLDRAFDTSTGRFVSFAHARLSSIFRSEYEPILLEKKIKDLEKGVIERDTLIQQMKERGIPKKEWEIILPPSEKLSPLLMYTELHNSLTKQKYNKVVKEIQKERYSNRRKKALSQIYDQWVTSVKTRKKK